MLNEREMRAVGAALKTLAVYEREDVVGGFMNRLPTRGWGPWRYDWYSVCSKHRHHDPDCRLCDCGSWVNNWWHLAGSLVYKVAPNLWRWWANRPFMKERWLKKSFRRFHW